jgi:colicin import membrane protein
MAVSLAKFKEIATAAELELVKASRAVKELTTAEAKQLASRARKHYGKWLDLSRGQARELGKKVGFGEIKANTELKLQAFAEALKKFEDHLIKHGSAPPAKKKAVSKTKQTRNAGHRAARAAVRGELSAVQESFKEPARKASKKKAVKKAAARGAATKRQPAAEAADSVESVPKKKLPKRGRPAPTPTANAGLELDKGKNRKASTAAKQARLDRSGVTSRVRGHVSARGKRSQGRRDAKG